MFPGQFDQCKAVSRDGHVWLIPRYYNDWISESAWKSPSANYTQAGILPKTVCGDFCHHFCQNFFNHFRKRKHSGATFLICDHGICKTPSHGIRLMKDTGVLDVILPEMMKPVGFNQHNPHHDKDVFEHIMCVLDKTSPVLHLRRLALLSMIIGKLHTLTIDERHRTFLWSW